MRVGAFIADKEWVPNSCGTYLEESTPAQEAAVYISMLAEIQANKNDISACVYTQITDVELEVLRMYILFDVHLLIQFQSSSANSAIVTISTHVVMCWSLNIVRRLPELRSQQQV